MNYKAQSIYLLREMWRMEAAKATTLEELKEAIKRAEDNIIEHNASYNDNATTAIYFDSEKTIALKYPL